MSEWDLYDYDDLTMTIDLEDDGKFSCDWYSNNGNIHVRAKDDTPKEVKAKLLEGLPDEIERDLVEFSFGDECQEYNHDEIERAIEIALDIHHGQKWLDGKPYIVHLWHIMLLCTDYPDEVVAMLKDTQLSASELEKEGFSPDVIEAIGVITQKEGEAFDSFIKRIYKNELAKCVKLWELYEMIDFLSCQEMTDEVKQTLHNCQWAYDYLSYIPSPLKMPV